MFPFLTGMVPPLVKEKFGRNQMRQRPDIEEERLTYSRRGRQQAMGNLLALVGMVVTSRATGSVD